MDSILDKIIYILSLPTGKIVIFVFLIVGAFLVAIPSIMRLKGLTLGWFERIIYITFGSIFLIGGLAVFIFIGIKAPESVEFQGVLNKDISVTYNGSTNRGDSVNIGFVFTNKTSNNIYIALSNGQGDVVLADNKGNAVSNYQVVGLPVSHPSNNNLSQYKIINPDIENPVTLTFYKNQMVGKSFVVKVTVLSMQNDSRNVVSDSFNLKFKLEP